MSWLKGLAGKAEDFLNQIDQNAAVALQKERKELNSNEALLTEVTWDGQQYNKGYAYGSEMSGGDVESCVINSLQLLILFLTRNVTNTSPRFTPPPTNGSNDSSVRTSPSLAGRSPVRAQKANSDDELIRFLNSSEPPVNRISEEVSFSALLLYFSPLS